MTFDLYWKIPPPEQMAAVTALFEKVMDTHGPEQRRLFGEMEALRYYRFGCNNGFMGRLLKAMDLFGMVDKEFTHSGFTGNAEQDEMVIQEFNKDRQPPRPPSYKFCSNDDWLVSPTEIAGALMLFDSFPPSARRLLLDIAFDEDKGCIDRFEEFIQFWRDAALHGGFEVR